MTERVLSRRGGALFSERPPVRRPASLGCGVRV